MNASAVRSADCLGPILFVYRASIDNNFISENGIVAVPGDESNIIGMSHMFQAPRKGAGGASER